MANHRTMLKPYKGYEICRIMGGLTYPVEYGVNKTGTDITEYTAPDLKTAHRYINKKIKQKEDT